jgi:hypothetical protein
LPMALQCAREAERRLARTRCTTHSCTGFAATPR